RFGHHRFCIGGGHRSWEGSVAFALVAVAVVVTCAMLAGEGAPWLVALAVAPVAAAVEAVSVRGLDNLGVPAVTLLLLSFVRGPGAGVLGAWIPALWALPCVAFLFAETVPSATSLSLGLFGLGTALLSATGAWPISLLLVAVALAALPSSRAEGTPIRAMARRWQ
ncbi:MAG: hypothetical protein ACYCWW_11585, partial [Deltaproteobacteria bacterium]